MMTMSAIDKQFIDDNMLTDEDFRFDIDEQFEISPENHNNLNSLSNKLQIPSEERLSTLQAVNIQNKEPTDLYKHIDDLLKEYGYNVGLKVEPLSPVSSYSRQASPEMVPAETNMSVIHIPEVPCHYEQNPVLSDTPPRTPPGIIDLLTDASTTCAPVEPIILSVRAAPGLPYSVPHAANKSHTVVSPLKVNKIIQPRPSNEEREPITAPSLISSNGHKTVLNSEQIAKLANGTLVTPGNVAIPVPSILKRTKANMRNLPSNSVQKTKKNSDGLVEFCTAALKRQERIIKNRESAHQSRMRRKEYVENLESELKQFADENSSLRLENCRLKLQIADLEKELCQLKSNFSPKKMKTTCCFMFAFCMLTFNFSQYSSLFEGKSLKPMRTDHENHRIGRVLLWENENNTANQLNGSKILLRSRRTLEQEIDSSFVDDWENLYNSSSCQHYINKTESLRLENDLLGWVERVGKKQNINQSKYKKPHLHSTPLIPLPKLQPGLRRKVDQKDIWAKKKNWNEILIYETPRKAYENFLDELHRRDDTFYFVSFSGDHLLLPAIAHNQTHRPRMSFVMPAMTLNDTVQDSDHHVSMMQIDCEVMDTKLIYIKESVIPAHLRQKHNNGTKSRSRQGSDYSNSQSPRRLQESHSKKTPKSSGKTLGTFT